MNEMVINNRLVLLLHVCVVSAPLFIQACVMCVFYDEKHFF